MTKIKKIYCIHHSHFDLGYTHPQELILELQEAYISQALDLCEKYENEEKPFRWTIEATLPLKKWLDDASKNDINRMKRAVRRNLISVCALPMHTTPLNDAFQIKKGLETKQEIETRLETSIKTAINHDINGQPWSFADLLIDSGVDFYLTGENIHFGGIPFPRPAEFLWAAPSKRELLCFLGEHYSLFSQFLQTDKRDTAVMYEGLINYLNHLNNHGYTKEYVVLTATNPPLLDNNSPDTGLYELIKEFNTSYPEFEIEMITPEMLRDILKENVTTKKVSGDWTDFWNFGSGSTPMEVKYNKIANQNIKKTLLLETANENTTVQTKRLIQTAIENMLLYNEHTWGAANSISDPTSLQAVIGKSKKQNYCYDSLSQSAFVLNKVQDDYLDVPSQLEKINFLTFTNTSYLTQKSNLKAPTWLFENRPYLSAFKSNLYLHEQTQRQSDLRYGPMIELAPFETVSVSIDEFKEASTAVKQLNDGSVENDIFKILFDKKTGSISSIAKKKSNWTLEASDEYGLFDCVLETIDESYNPSERETFFPRDIELANYSVSVWNHGWIGKRNSLNKQVEISIYRMTNELVFEQKVIVDNDFIEWIERKIVLVDDSDEIKVSMKVKRKKNLKPNAQYLSIPTNLNEGWQAVFESANTFCRLDEDQIGSVSKDWLTIDNSIAFFDGNKGFYLATADTPLIQINGFSFGRESKTITRNENPLFLPWLYNNYWDTNFSASDENEIEHEFLIKPFVTYNLQEQVALGNKVTNPIEITWGDTEKTQLLDLPIQLENIEILSVEKGDDGMKLFVKNYSEEVGCIKVNSSSQFKIQETDFYGKPSGDMREQVKVEPNFFGYFKIK
ncbi:hypothetical protein P7H31_05295 [Enterococcus asini]|uniref:glycoside hydrolase family 38 N-terminal domain-containing protein n=1 Tax=Enterococcus asini TaxID=57732 RepID=UPI00288E206D|nr:hypothetical protein [Enterococcus asini]MDT2763719.1 hypothetical protein [Enterococcus asini]